MTRVCKPHNTNNKLTVTFPVYINVEKRTPIPRKLHTYIVCVHACVWVWVCVCTLSLCFHSGFNTFNKQFHSKKSVRNYTYTHTEGIMFSSTIEHISFLRMMVFHYVYCILNSRWNYRFNRNPLKKHLCKTTVVI